MKKWQCIVCGWIYDEAEGYEEEDIAQNTPIKIIIQFLNIKKFTS